MTLIDSHAHLNFSAYDEDRNKVIKRCQDKEMKVINVGSQLETSKKAIEIAEKFSTQGGSASGWFATVGIHPIHLGQHERDELETKEHESVENMDLEEVFERIVKLVESDKGRVKNNSEQSHGANIVAIGETGLDYFRLDSGDDQTKKLQREYFLKHIKLAQDNDLPMVFHCRGEKDDPLGAYEEMLWIIEGVNSGNPLSASLRSPLERGRLKGVIHCFDASLEIAKRFTDLGIYIGLTGIVTFGKKTAELQTVAKEIPLDKLLIETDCPYLSPEPYRGKRNEPIYVEFIAKKIAELKGISAEKVIEITGRNAEKLFKI